MFNLLKSGVSVLAQAAQEVAEELNRPSNAPAGRGAQRRPLEDDGQAVFLGSEGRLVLCGFPHKQLATEVFREDRSLRPFSSPAALRDVLKARFPSPATQILVWNLSGIKYAYEDLDGNIIEYDFPARPILPFAALVEVANAINSWLASSKDNVAVVHDISGRRAAVVAACAMELTSYYIKETALRSVANEMGPSGNALVASQLRYFDYFCISRRPDSAFNADKRLRIDRVIINGVPDYSSESKLAISPDLGFCWPYLKVIDSKGQCIYSSPLADRAVFARDISFSVVPDHPVIVSSDVMLRFFHSKAHESPKGTDVPMFAVSFHVGFVTDVVLRFTFQEIDGTAKSPRFPKDMFIDVIFSENLDAPLVQAEVAKQKATMMQLAAESKQQGEGLDTLDQELEALDLGDVDVNQTSDEAFDFLTSPSSSRPASTVQPSKPPVVANDDGNIHTEPSSTRNDHEMDSVSKSELKSEVESPKKRADEDEERKVQTPKISGAVQSPKATSVESTPPKSVTVTPKDQPPVSAIKKVEAEEDTLEVAPVPPSPLDLNRGDSVLKEIEAALNEDDFAVEDFDISELDDAE